MTTDNAINRVLKSHGLPSLNEPGVVAVLASIVEDHRHFTELLRACDPTLRREMYEAMRPHLRFPAKALDEYITAAQEHAAAAELPTMNSAGGLDPYQMPVIHTEPEPHIQVLIFCSKCRNEAQFAGPRYADAIFEARKAGWAWDELKSLAICSVCLDAGGDDSEDD